MKKKKHFQLISHKVVSKFHFEKHSDRKLVWLTARSPLPYAATYFRGDTLTMICIPVEYVNELLCLPWELSLLYRSDYHVTRIFLVKPCTQSLHETSNISSELRYEI